MVRKYNRTYQNIRNGKRFKPYCTYSKQDLEDAVADVKATRLSTREAEAHYGVPRSTINRHLKNKPLYTKPGHPTLFSEAEEKTFLKYIKTMGEWGFPLDLIDLRVFAQKYLNKIGRTVYTLKDNLPGRDWAACFLQRYKNEISHRYAANISSDRAALNSEAIDTFFNNYEKTIKNIEPDCIINYDETNLTDDPGSKKYIYKRGCKYPERVINSSKSAISIMFSGTASGILLPTYVVYKAEHLYNTWVLGGPKDTRYNKSKSGWFDSICFEDWFQSVILPYVKTKQGQKVLLIGDNLSSHFSEKVLAGCKSYNIVFVCLPPKSTHVLQPLDVAFFGPLKHYWRTILTTWKKTEGRKCTTLAKNNFPKLFSRLLDKLHAEDAASQNLKAGFAKCGLIPVDRNRPKERLPQSTSAVNMQENTSAVMVEMLEELRGCASEPKIARKKRCNVPAGKSITLADITNTQKETVKDKRKANNKGKGKGKKSSTSVQKTADTQDIATPETIQIHQTDHNTLGTDAQDFPEPTDEFLFADTTIGNILKNKKKRQYVDTSSSDSEVEMSVHSDSDLLDVSDNEMLLNFNQTAMGCDEEIQESSVLNLHNLSLEREIQRADETQNESIPGPSTDVQEQEIVDYEIGASILVRYILKKKVEYYVGHVLSKNGPNYRVSFLRKSGRRDNVKFTKAKKEDVDVVTVDMIVKLVELMSINEQETEYIFLNDEDYFYFDY